MQEMKVRTESEILVAKNLEVETAVEDLISELARYPIEMVHWIPSDKSITGTLQQDALYGVAELRQEFAQ